MKIFISQPMRGKTDEQIRRERDEVILKLNRRYNGDIEILDTIFNLDGNTHPLVYLGKSIEVLAQADLAYFMKGWDEARGCVVEHLCAARYGIEIEQEVK